MEKAFYRKVSDAKLGIDSYIGVPIGKPRKRIKRIFRKSYNKLLNKLLKGEHDAM